MTDIDRAHDTRMLPLLREGPADEATFAWRDGAEISRGRFVCEVLRVAAALPDRRQVLNLCADRYRFSVGLAAAMLRGQVSLLPPSTHPETIRHLRTHFPDVYGFVEAPQADIDLPQVLFDEALSGGLAEGSTPSSLAVPADRTVAQVFTSGSTGAPMPHRKRWGSLVVNVRSAIERLAMNAAADEPQWAIVATVPAQHMYGFESSLLIGWLSGAAIVAERPFFPADIVASLESIPSRRLLVTTPFHLRTLLAERIALPRIDAILCATAPLSIELAREAEVRCGAPVAEIYGCTETGQIASRVPTVDPRWQLLGDVTLDHVDGRTLASGGHVETPTALADAIELAPDFATSRRFALVGRTGDLVNIAGKRTSLGYLNVQLNAIDGVIDGAFFLPDDSKPHDDGRVARLAAVVVAPTLDAARLLHALRARIDAVFLPRPLHFVDALPRNSTGKLTRAELDALVAANPAAGATRDGDERADRPSR